MLFYQINLTIQSNQSVDFNAQESYGLQLTQEKISKILLKKAPLEMMPTCLERANITISKALVRFNITVPLQKSKSFFL